MKGGDLVSIVRKKLSNYESLRDASRKLGVCHVYLHRLATGAKTNPSDDVLRKLGIAREYHVTYKEIK